jgi:hypothetical protein
VLSSGPTANQIPLASASSAPSRPEAQGPAPNSHRPLMNAPIAGTLR